MKENENNQPNRRPFATGSKPGPDELDRYLEERGYYRKHVARDASSLFRVVSEQVFDIQNYHDKVRQDCATFMDLHIKDYANEVDKNFYNYVSHLRKSRTYGTPLELRVMARMYKRNVIMFEPNQNMEAIEKDFVMDEEYSDKEPIRVFYSHKDKHFDTIYTMDEVERLAECQAIVYEILYTDVFKLPDVNYAVERMLHDQEEETTLPLEDDPTKYKNASGDMFDFDSPENTHCVLKDPKTCHFHNQVDFEDVVNENKDAITIINRSDAPGKLKIYKPIDGFLYKKEKSCVRQLLDEKITPFPYKVAKALDPSIYRNTEFELWSENRKQQRLKWFDANGLPLKENDDRYWPYYNDYEKGRRNEPFGLQKYGFGSSIISDDFMSLDEETKKKYGPMNPKDEFNFGHFTSFEHFQPHKSSIDQIVMPVNLHHRNFRNNRRRGFNHNHPGNNPHHHHNQQQPQHHHQQGGNMNYVGDIERENFQYENDQMYAPQQPVYQEMGGNYQYFQYEQNSPPNAIYQNHPPSQYQYIPQSPFPQPVPAVPYQPPMVPYGYPQPAIFSYPPPSQQQPVAVTPAIPQGNMNINNNTSNNNSGNEFQRDYSRDSLNLIRDVELTSFVNRSPKESNDPNGNDLPTNDVASLQFYYNLGVRYYFASGISRQLENVSTQFDHMDLNQENKTEPPPVPVNTPVSTKPPSNIGQSGHRYQHNNNNPNNHHNNNNRRIFNQNSQPIGTKDNKPRFQHNQQRKEIQFNSNVKNVHKAESSKTSSTAHSSAGNIGQNASTSNLDRTSSNLERTSSSLTTTTSHNITPSFQLSPIAASQEAQMPVQEQQMIPQATQMQLQPQYFQQYQPQNIIQQSPQPVLCYQMENGELMPLTHAVQPVYYGYSAPQTPMYYQAQQPQVLDGTMSSTDSGVLDISTAYAAYQQPTYPIIYQPPPTPIYYPQTPMLTTPHVATTPQLAPVFPVTFNGNASTVQQAAVVQQESVPMNDTVVTGLNETASSSNTTN